MGCLISTKRTGLYRNLAETDLNLNKMKNYITSMLNHALVATHIGLEMQ